MKTPSHTRLVTHIVDPDDLYIRSDAVLGVKERLLAKLDRTIGTAEIASIGFDKPFFLVEHDFILAPR